MEVVQINTPIAVMFVVYALLMLYIGFYFYKQNKNSEDYFLGGRTMGPVISALSAGASDMSGWLLMGLPGALYVSGFIDSYIAIGLTIGASLNWIFVAKRLRIYTSVIANSLTIPDYFETRFDDDKHILRIVCAVVILIFFTFYVSSGLVSGAKLFDSTFGIRYDYALTTGTIIIVAYTFLGGYKAVCWTDMIQGLLMMMALIIVPLVMLYHLGGFGEAMNIVKEIKPQALSMGEGVGVISIISALAWGLGYFGQPHILVRFMSIRSTKDIPMATFIGIAWMAVCLLSACMIGILGIAYVHKFELSLQDPEKKMSKSDENPNAYISMNDSTDDIIRKFKRAVTDSEACIKFDEENKKGISNLLTIYSLFSGMTIPEAEKQFEGVGYGEFKLAVGEQVANVLQPITAEKNRILSDKAYLESVLKDGAEKANYLAHKMMRKVYKKVGLIQL